MCSFWKSIFVGLFAARSNNNTGIAGIAGGWGDISGVKVMALKYVTNDSLGVSAASVAQCIRYAALNGAKICNMSFSYSDSIGIPSLAEALDSASRVYKILLVASSGNGDIDSLEYPASDSLVISVGAVSDWTLFQSRWVSFLNGSSYGNGLDVVAPTRVITTIMSGAYDGYFDGTSGAAPHVTGVVALLLLEFRKDRMNSNSRMQDIYIVLGPDATRARVHSRY